MPEQFSYKAGQGKVNHYDFDSKKSQILHDLSIPEETDLSPKGSVDIPILPVMEVINTHPDYVTTSSCSGRIAIYCDPVALGTVNQLEDGSKFLTTKGGGHWLYVTHDSIDSKSIEKDEFDPVNLLLPNLEIIEELNEISLTNPIGVRIIWFKFEPMVLHVQARSISHGKKLLSIALGLGFQNSGIVLSNSGRVIVGIRSSAKLDVPIAYINPNSELQAKLLVSKSYLLMLLRMGNFRFDRNLDHINRFNNGLKEQLYLKGDDNNKIESKGDRRLRKIKEGLSKQNEIKLYQNLIKKDDDDDDELITSIDELILN